MTKKWRSIIIIVVLSLSIVFILWLTIFSRIGSYFHHFYPPLSSYRAILNGSGKALLENIGNVLLFLPIGVAVALLFRVNVRQSLLIGLTSSLIIECCQWFFWLGSFEIDDLIHNTIGTGIGAMLITRTAIGEKARIDNNRRVLMTFLVLTVVFVSFIFGYQELRWQEMKRLAALNDREDGTRNLLVLRPDPVYMGKTGVEVTYSSDGSILIEGSSESRAWIEIGKIKLSEGTYLLTGLSGVEENTIALVLDAFDPVEGRDRRITQEVGFASKAVFNIENEKVVRALVSIYPGSSYSVVARPTVYKLTDGDN